MRCHGRTGQSNEWNGAALGLFWVSWQPVHSFATSSIALSIPGHYVQLLAKAFILTIPRWPSWSSANSCAWCLGGITTCEPHIRQPSCMVSSSFFLWNGSSSFLTNSWPPLLCVFHHTCQNQISLICLTDHICVDWQHFYLGYLKNLHWVNHFLVTGFL